MGIWCNQHQEDLSRRKGIAVTRFVATALLLTMGLFVAGCEQPAAPTGGSGGGSAPPAATPAAGEETKAEEAKPEETPAATEEAKPAEEAAPAEEAKPAEGEPANN